MWRTEHNNDTGPFDESYDEWWSITDGEKSFDCRDQAHAQWLCGYLNGNLEHINMNNPDTPPQSITVPRSLLRGLIEDATGLQCDRFWTKDEQRCGYPQAYAEREARINEATHIVNHQNETRRPIF